MLWRGGYLMGDFEAYADDIKLGMDFLEHHQILGGKWGVHNGPPYPLGSGDHSASEKSAAKAAGVKVGKDSGKGSIENVKKKKPRSKSVKKELTPEEKREAALAASKSGDKKKITKNIEELSTEELRDAAERARLKDQLTKKDPSEVTISKAEKDKLDAIRSGDKEKVKQYADKMSYQELVEAMNKIKLTAELNYVEPPPTAMDKIKKVANTLGTMKEAGEKAIGAYNVAAKVYNATHKDSQWPLIGEKPGGDNKEKEEKKEKAKEIVQDVAKQAKDAKQQNQKEAEEKSYKQQKKEELRNFKTDYKTEKKKEKWLAKQEAKGKKPEETTQEETPEESPKSTRDRAPLLSKATFYSKKKESNEPSDEQKQVIENERRKDNDYLNQLKNLRNKKVDDYSDVSYDDIFSDSMKDSMRNTMNQRINQQKAYNSDVYDDLYDWMYNSH